MKKTLIPICTVLAAGAIPSLAGASEVAQYPVRELSGDFNGDGNIDRVIATPKANSQAGQIELFIGDGSQGSLWWKGIYHSSWPKPPTVLTEGNAIFGGSASAYRRFGAGLTVGDFDGDGKDDLAFSSPGAAVNGYGYAGVVYVLYGKDLAYAGGAWSYSMSSMYIQGAAGVRGAAEAYDYFGEFLTAGDFDCDGIDDLAIGTPREDLTIAAQTTLDGGVVQVLYGTAGGLTAIGDEYFAESLVGGNIESSDKFGGALAAGRFSTQGGSACDTLAIGVPGQDVSGNNNAGAVYTLAGTLNGLDLSGQLWHQDIAGVDGTTATNEEFGSRLGTASLPVGEDLWIGVPGELCGDPDERRFHVIRAGNGGLTTLGDSRFCSRHEPGLRDTEVGWLVEKRDRFGPYLQYLPTGVDATSKVLVVVHGTPNPLLAGEDPWDHAARAARFWVDIDDAWIQAAERENLILIAPGFTVNAFATVALDCGHPARDCQTPANGLYSQVHAHGGYRNLYGRDIQADAWVNLIVDSYQDVGLLPGGQLYIYGHSAGAQMVSRYIARNPTRLIAAALSSANTVAVPDAAQDWGYGLDPLPLTTFDWMKDDFSGIVSNDYAFVPSAADWADALATQIYINVGELENVNGDTHVETAIGYRDTAKSFMDGLGRRSKVELCIVQGHEHDYIDMYPAPMDQLFPNGDPPTCVAP